MRKTLTEILSSTKTSNTFTRLVNKTSNTFTMIVSKKGLEEIDKALIAYAKANNITVKDERDTKTTM